MAYYDLIEVGNDGMPVFKPELRSIKEFKDLIASSRITHSNNKKDSATVGADRATKLLAYIYFMCQPSSPYVEQYPLESQWETRKNKVMKAISLDIIPKEDVMEAAIEKYKEPLSNNVYARLINSARHAANQTEDFLSGVDFDEMRGGKPKYDPKVVITMIKDLGGVMEGLDKLERKVKEEQKQNNGKAKKNFEMNEFNTGDVLESVRQESE